MYDLGEVLERSYGIYRECLETGESFIAGHIMQDTAPVSSNGDIMCFLTTVSLPVDAREHTEWRTGAVFDRETGEKLDNRALFQVPWEKAFRHIMELEGLAGTPLGEEMEAAMEPEYIVLFPESLDIYFPAGTLPSQGHGYIVSAEYGQMGSIIHSWAVPDETPAP